MNIEKAKRYSLSEIVLLVIFVFGLLIACWLVRVKRQITLSEPVSLAGAGLSVSMPENRKTAIPESRRISMPDDWGGRDSWSYETNSMILTGHRKSRGGDVVVQWRYNLHTSDDSPNRVLQRWAAATKTAVQKTYTIEQPVAMEYAFFGPGPNAENGLYRGVAMLDFGRSLELLVVPHMNDATYAERIFKTLAGSIHYTKPQELNDGLAMLDAFLLTREKEGPRQSQPEEAFLVTDEQGRYRGYYIRRDSFADDGQSYHRMQIRKLEYGGWQIESDLRLNPAGKDYLWKTASRPSQSPAPMTCDIKSDGKGTLRVESNVGPPRILDVPLFILPEPLLSDYARLLLASNYAGVVVDVLEDAGEAFPVRLEKILPDQVRHAKLDNAASVVRLDFLHKAGSYEELFFNQTGELIGKYEKQPFKPGQFWEAVSPEQLRDIFQNSFQLPADPIVRIL
ncbi:MAG: hypothetical protein L0Y36_08525 [Planctomycetales bacterium]|nr:hypothetical protein [Planctomycetales bacterium]